MADWYGFARSNYFKVKDETEFRHWADSIGDLEVIQDSEGRVGLISHNQYGHWPSSRFNEDTEGEEDIDVFITVAEHLQEGSVAIFIEVGAEKLRYLTGWAVAINSKGEEVQVNLDDIYDRAKPLTSEGEEITIAEW